MGDFIHRLNLATEPKKQLKRSNSAVFRGEKQVFPGQKTLRNLGLSVYEFFRVPFFLYGFDEHSFRVFCPSPFYLDIDGFYSVDKGFMIVVFNNLS